MNAVVMDHVQLGDESIVGALTLVREKEIIPPRSLVAGNPGKIIREVSEEMIKWKTEGTGLYQRLPVELNTGWKACDPNPEGTADDVPVPPGSYPSWKS
jgi:carbonic anhydrase/acetyltransferase-like protein (isoleucine patch superfamily)